jgi:hypothetical protein
LNEQSLSLPFKNGNAEESEKMADIRACIAAIDGPKLKSSLDKNIQYLGLDCQWVYGIKDRIFFMKSNYNNPMP